MTHTCNLSTWAAEARELLQIWGQLGLHRECPTTLDYMWSKALPLWCGIVNKEDSWLWCVPRPFALQPFVGVALPPERNPFGLACSTAGGPPLGLVPWDLCTLDYLIILLWELCAIFQFFTVIGIAAMNIIDMHMPFSGNVFKDLGFLVEGCMLMFG